MSATHTNSSNLFRFNYIRIIVFGSLVVLYLFVWRPGRAYLTQEAVKPPIEHYVNQHPESWHLRSQQKSVTFTVYNLDRERAIAESEKENWQEFVFSFPWGFYLFFPLLFLAFVRNNKPFLQFHLLFQLATGLICILAFILAITQFSSSIHIYRMLTYYVVPGFAFLVIFAAIFQKKLVLR